MTLEPGHHVTYSGKEWVVVKLNENTAIIEPVGGKQHERKAVRFSDLTPTGEKEDLNILPEMTKKCKDCQKIKPIRLFGRMSGEGRSLCNDCVTKRAQAQYIKTCTQCSVEKHVSEFDRYRKNQRKNICRECLSVRLKEGHMRKKGENQKVAALEVRTIPNRNESRVLPQREVVAEESVKLPLKDKAKAQVSDPIKPHHYQMDGRDLIDQWAERYPKEVFVGIMESHIEKYVVRHTKKGKPVEDLEKALEYINRLKKYHEEVG